MNDESNDDVFEPPDTVEIPIETTLDLHPFAPREVRLVVEDYLDAAIAKGFTEVRLIHGKGSGTLRRTVRTLLERHPAVLSFSDDHAGNWGATVVTLKRE